MTDKNIVNNIVKKILKKEDGLFLVISLNEKVNPKLLNKKIKLLLDKFKIDKKNVIIVKDPANIYDIPIFLIFEKNKTKLEEKGVFIGYELKFLWNSLFFT